MAPKKAAAVPLNADIKASTKNNTPNTNNSNTNEAVLITGPQIVVPKNGGDCSLNVVEPETCQNVGLEDDSMPLNPLRRLLDNLTKPPSPEERELTEVVGSAPVSIPSPNHSNLPSTKETYDICREYSYDTDDDDEDGELRRHYFNHDNESRKRSQNQPQLDHSNRRCYVLGKSYHPIHDYTERRSDESSLFWFTYRCNFPSIQPYGMTSDAGWGCMLRALQMLCCQALKMHYKHRDWKDHNNRRDPFLRSLLSWFADFASKDCCLYSLHNMVAAGLQYDQLPGEWYGPGTACFVLRDLVTLHEKQPSKHSRKPVFRVHVAAGGTVYRDEIEATMTRNHKAEREQQQSSQATARPSLSHPLAWEEELVDESNHSTGAVLDWDTALLLLIPLRLGLKSFNEDYVPILAHTFSLPQSVGVLGGRPRGARWFYGSLSDGSKCFGLDPHTVQAAPKRRQALVNGKPSLVVELSDDYLQSVHTNFPEAVSLARLDPSIALGFYCRDRQDLERLFDNLHQWKCDHIASPELFAVADKAPNYSSSNVDVFDLEDNVEDEGSSSEEDEYVVL